MQERSSLPEQVDVLIIGAGAAGLMCASKAGKRGRNVLIIDHANKVGKKILMSGGGRCNFTNLHTQANNFISTNPNFCKSALSRYTPYDFIALVEEYGIPFHEKKLGQLFCDNKAKDILNMLVKECQLTNVKIRTKCDVIDIEFQDKCYSVTTSLGICKCDSLVIASGGLSIPSMGASDFGYMVAKQFNIGITNTQAALVPFTANKQVLEKLSQLSGSSIAVSVSCNNASFNENLLFTHRGISGPAILQISSYWNPNNIISINLLPKVNLYDLLIDYKKQGSKLNLKNILSQYISKKIVRVLLELWQPEIGHCDKVINQLSDATLNTIAHKFHNWQFSPNGTEGYRTAEVTLGGVNCYEISSKSMEANNQKGLFFIGEVLDVTGHLGGHNFQWAWASAVAASEYV